MLSRRFWGYDAILAALLVLLSVTAPADSVAGVICDLVGSVTVTLRRRFPLSAGLLLTAAQLGNGGFGDTTIVMTIVNLLVVQAVVTYGPPGRRTWAVAAVETVAYVQPWDVAWFQVDLRQRVIVSLLSAVLPVLLGLYVRSVLERAELLERRAEIETELARADERRLLAAEMHDVVGHGISLIAVQAGALESGARDPEGTRTTARAIGATARETLEQMRELVAILRAPESGAAAIPLLVARTRAAGLSVALTAYGDLAAVPPEQGRAAYRVVQEALTNAIRYAGGARVAVTAAVGEDALRLEIANGRPIHPGPGLPAGGTGLHTLRARVESLGGTFTAGRSPDGGFEITAVLPL